MKPPERGRIPRQLLPNMATLFRRGKKKQAPQAVAETPRDAQN
jgi:hypothetical protein